MPAIFSSSRIEPVARSMPVLVPIPSSPRKRAPASVCERRLEVLARRARRCAATTSPLAKVSCTPATVDAARTVDGTSKRIVPLAERSCGPVKTSPLGMLRRPSELIQVRPVDAQAQIGSVGLDPDLARRLQALDEPLPGARSARATPRPGRAGRGTARRLHERRVVVARPSRPAGRAPAVGQSVPHQRRASRASLDRRAGPAGARDQRRIDAGQRARVGRRVDRQRTRRSPASLGQLERREAVELRRLAWR